jgi:transposase IS66 family protein
VSAVFVDDRVDHYPIAGQAFLDNPWGQRRTLDPQFFAPTAGALFPLGYQHEVFGRFDGGYIQADETPVDVQSERTKGKHHQAYLWQYSRPGGPVVFDFQLDRGRQGPRQFLGEFAPF